MFTRNIAVALSYDGTRYHGWQIQKNAVTVCQTVQDALEKICGHKVALVGCGRTDAGVHAERYIANFRTNSRIPAERLPFALNTFLPCDIAAFDAYDVPMNFHAAFSCVKKEYTYRLYHAGHRNPLLDRGALFWPRKPELEAWKSSASAFVGTHDFAAVRSQGTPVKSTVRTVFYFDVFEEAENRFAFRAAANGFLYNMVRAMAGTVLYAGLGKIADTAKVIESLNRTAAGPTVPPHGLYMTGVWYGRPFENGNLIEVNDA